MNMIPDQLFELVENRPWRELKEHDKKLVLQYLSEKEYMRMHELCKATGHINNMEQHLKLPDTVKGRLDEAFQKQFQKQATIPLWQAAAVFIIMLGGFLGYAIYTSNTEKSMVTTIHDTLYVPQYVIKEHIKTDTVVLYKEVVHTKVSNVSSTKYDIANNPDNHRIPENTGMRTLSPAEIVNSIENKGTKSMWEDTLYHKIGYARI